MAEIKTKIVNNHTVAILSSREKVITDLSSALELMMTVKYETGADRLVLPVEAIAEDFFVLSTRLAGEILQRFVNYRCKLGIYGDLSPYTRGSKALRDFIYESNQGEQVYFGATEEETVAAVAHMK